jgi:Protein of unknown function (DUF1566)
MNRPIFLLFVTLIQATSVVQAAQSCTSGIPRTAPDNRYLDNNNGTVTDRKTALTWKQCSEGETGAACAGGATLSMDWQSALQTASNSTFAGFTDWRLPNVNELQSLLERACYSPAINALRFPGPFNSNYYWSATSGANNSSNAWVVGFFYGDADRFARKIDTYVVRLVRGGQ